MERPDQRKQSEVNERHLPSYEDNSVTFRTAETLDHINAMQWRNTL